MIKDYLSLNFSKVLARTLVSFFFIINLVFLPTATAAEYSVYGPHVFMRYTGKPVVETEAFKTTVPGSSYLLKIYNGGLTGDEYEHVSASIITFNGVEILTPNELNQKVDYIEKTVTLQQLNELAVEVRGKPNGALVINVYGTDNDSPIINTNVSPLANSGGWHNTDVTVTFDCLDNISGIASCPTPVTITTEGAAQVVTGTAVDNAGNTAETSVTVNLDKTLPVVNVTSPLEGALFTEPAVTVVGQIVDISSQVTATLDGESVTLFADGSFTHVVTLQEGLNILTVVATDEAGNTSENYLSVTLQSNQAPVVGDLTVSTQEDTPVNAVLLASDPDGDVLSYQVKTQPQHGVISGTLPNLIYAPNADFNGIDNFTYIANDGALESNIATVTIDVAAVNDAPISQAQTVTTDEDINASLVLSATDIDSASLTYTVTQQPLNGTLNGVAPNLVYTPNENFNGSDSLVFTANDGVLDSAEATVTITVQAVNDAPVIQGQLIELNEDTSANIVLMATDIDSAALTYSITQQPSSGMLSGVAPNLIYTPNENYFGSDVLIYSVSDGQLNDEAQVNIDVSPVNDAPVSNDIVLTTAYNTVVGITLIGSDLESDPLTYNILSQPDSGVLNGASNALTYVPTTGFSGVDSFTYVVNDGQVDSTASTVSITVEPPANIIKISSEPVLIGFINQSYQYTITASDPDGFNLQYSLLTFPDGMTIDSQTGKINWLPTTEGDYSVTISVVNTTGGSVEQSYQIKVVDPEPSHEGDDFWLLFSNNSTTREGGNYLYISSNYVTTGDVDVIGLGSTIPFSVTPGEVTVVKLDTDYKSKLVQEVDNKSIHITAENKITVYAVNQKQYSSDGYLAIPTRALGTDYLLIDYQTTSFLDVLAIEDNTTFKLILHKDFRLDTKVIHSPPIDYSAGEEIVVTLNRGQTYHFKSDYSEFSGVNLQSDKPVSVFSGNQCVFVPYGHGTCDHIVEHLLPVKYWGTEFLSMPLAERSFGDTFMVVASVDDTIVKIDGEILTTINRSDYIEKIIDGPSVITANHPIMVAQFSNGWSYDNVVTRDRTRDPFMMLLPAREQFIKSYTFATPDNYIINNYVNIIIPSEGLSSLMLDGITVDTSQFVQINNTNWWGSQLRVGTGSHTLSADTSFGAAMYGYGSFESYGYPGGMLLPNITSDTQILIGAYNVDKQLGEEHCIDINVSNFSVPVNAVRVDITVSGTHTYVTHQFTDINGFAQYCYAGSNEGYDAFEVKIGDLSQQGSINWTAVLNGDGQQTPIFTSTPVLDASVGFDYSYPVKTFDADIGSVLTLELVTAPDGMFLSGGNEVLWSPTEFQVGDHDVMLRVSDNEGHAVEQIFVIHVSQRNRAPVINSYPESVTAYVNHWYSSFFDVVDPDGDTVYFEQIAGDITIPMSPTGSGFLYYPVEEAIGEHLVTIRVSDKLGAYVDVDIPVTVIKNIPPVQISEPLAQAKVSYEYVSSLGFIDEDNTIDGLNYRFRYSPQGMTVDADGFIHWIPNETQVGVHRVAVYISDSVDGAYIEFDITVYSDAQPFEVFAEAAPNNISLGESASIHVSSLAPAGAVSYTLTVDGVDVPVDIDGNATYINTDHFGSYEMVVTGNDGHEIISSTYYFSVIDPNDTTPPLVTIETPIYQQRITKPTAIIASISDGNFFNYKLYLASVSTPADKILLSEGLTEGASIEVGVLDPTMLMNGQYNVTLVATDTGGLQTTEQITVRVDGDLKVGNFSFTIEDIVSPMSGMPVRVTRTYDSRRKYEKLDFGYGWSLSFQDAKVEESRPLGFGWQLNEYYSGPLNATVDYCVEPQGAPYVTVVLPTGKMQSFEVSAEPQCNRYLPVIDVKLKFTPVDNTQSTLALQSSPTLRLVGNHLEILGSDTVFDPSKYIMTTREGFEYQLDQAVGIEKITEPNGSTLTFTSTGVEHSDGKKLSIGWSEGRVFSIRDFNGSSTNYHYSNAGDLVWINSQKTGYGTYKYNYQHGLTEINDANALTVIKNFYDDNGRLIAQENSDGERTEFNHNLEGRESIVTNTRGYSTIFNYDDEGNVLSQVDAQGNLTQYTYDGRGNQLSVTDANGNVSFATYNANSDQLTQTDSLGNTISFTYNQRGQELFVTDAKNNVFENSYDTVGNLLTVTDPDGNIAGNNINAKGQVELTQDVAGNITTYSYDEFGNKISETNARGNTVTYTYDANGNMLTETHQRTVDGVLQSETTSYVYNRNNQVTSITNPLGEYIAYNYNNLAQKISMYGNTVNSEKYEYDAYNRLIKTSYADGSSKINSYDGEGNLLTEIDRKGNTTRHTYDPLDRLIETVYPDGSATRTEYNAVGRIFAEIDENNNRTEHEYVVAGRRILTRDALGFETTFAYDANGNLVSQTDANGKTTQFEYDNLDNRIKTIYHDGTQMLEGYDALGRVIARTNQNNLSTAYGYDALGRLISVTDALGNITSYTYDEVGNKLTQIDAEGRTTSWTYDALGREISRTLPLLQSNSTSYDSKGNISQTIDFNGQITQFSYNLNSYLIRTEYGDGSNETYSYDANGNRTRTTDRYNQTESWSYDSRNRLAGNTKTNGDQLDYNYDNIGNRTMLTVTPAGGISETTGYGFDALNRLQSVSDSQNQITSYSYDNVGNRQSITYSNGNTTNYVYDDLNRLIRLSTVDSLSNVLTDYQYTLDNSGHRTQIIEATSRTSNYIYDDLYRLTTEDITDALNGNYHASYQYDAVGNRISSTINGVSTLYTVDNNDRLIQQGGETFTYDDNGNTLTKAIDADITAYSYNVKDELVQADVTEQGVNTVSSYQYDVNGIRNRKVANGETFDYLVDDNRAYAQVLRETNATTGNITDYLYGDDLIKQTKAANDSYYLYDGLGSTRALSDSTGTITDSYNYESFGTILNQTGATPNDYLFTGEQYDSGLDNYYLRARYYDQSIGRFTQQDSYPGIINDPVSLHKYLYANIDPVNNIDPSGKFSIGSLMTAVNIATTLASRAQTAYTIFSLATGDEEVTANQIGSAIIVGMLGKGAGKIIGLVGGKVAKECLLKNSFVEGTLVSSENGLVNIESIEIGDKVWAYNEETGEKTLQEVVHLIQGEDEKELVEIKLASGEIIVATANHPFYVPQLNDPWVDAFDLSIDNILIDNEQNPVVINSIERETKKAKVYNLTVANDHTYYVSKEPVLVHNCGFIGKSVRSILQGGMRNDKRLRKKKGNQFVGKSGGLQQAEEEFRLMSKRFSVPGSFKVTPNGSYNVTFKDGTVMTLKRSAEKPTIYLKIEGKTDAFRYYID